MTNLVKYAIPMLLGFVGGLASHHFSPSANAQDNDQPDEAEVHELIRTRRLEVVTEAGDALIKLSASSEDHGRWAAIFLGDSGSVNEDGLPSSDTGYLQMGYTWSDGTLEPTEKPPFSRIRLEMRNMEADGSRIELKPYNMLMEKGLYQRYDSKDEERERRWDKILIEPNKINMDRNGLTNVHLGYAWDGAEPRLRLGPFGARNIDAWIPRWDPQGGEQLPRIEISGPRNKLAATFPENPDEEESDEQE